MQVTERFLHLKSQRTQVMRRVVSLLRPRLQQLVHRKANVLCDLAEQCWRDIVSGMEWDRRAASIVMAVLSVGSTLAD